MIGHNQSDHMQSRRLFVSELFWQANNLYHKLAQNIFCMLIWDEQNHNGCHYVVVNKWSGYFEPIKIPTSDQKQISKYLKDHMWRPKIAAVWPLYCFRWTYMTHCCFLNVTSLFVWRSPSSYQGHVEFTIRFTKKLTLLTATVVLTYFMTSCDLALYWVI